MNVVLWILQALLAIQFAFHGWFYLFPPPEMVDKFPIAAWFRIFIGVAEWLASVGLLLPGIVRIQPGLVPLAAAGVALITASASVFHFSRGETSYAVFTIGLFALSAFVATMRWKVKPIPRRTLAAKGQS